MLAVIEKLELTTGILVKSTRGRKLKYWNRQKCMGLSVRTGSYVSIYGGV